MRHPTHTPRLADANPNLESQLLRNHYAAKRVDFIWDQRRVRRLRDFMRTDDHFLAAMLNMEYKQFEGMVYRNGRVTGPAAAMLTMLEHSIMGEVAYDTVELFPLGGQNDGS